MTSERLNAWKPLIIAAAKTFLLCLAVISFLLVVLIAAGADGAKAWPVLAIVGGGMLVSSWAYILRIEIRYRRLSRMTQAGASEGE